MEQFLDVNGNKIELSFLENAFQMKAEHVLVICQLGDSWLVTNHQVRGLEFPGGKVEEGETLVEAAHREVYEETGAILDELTKIAEYSVTDQKASFVKAVFWGKVKSIEKTSGYYETKGPVMVQGDLSQLRFRDEYSFIMKDRVIEDCLKHIVMLQKE